MTIVEIEKFTSVVGVVISACSLFWAAFNIQTTLKTNRAKFWLDLRSAFSNHDEVHRKLRPGGVWAEGLNPTTPDDFALIEAYMGLFEHCEIMLSQKLIDEKTFKEIYKYRLVNLVNNKWVNDEKLDHEEASWKRFISLLKRMKVNRLTMRRSKEP